MSDTLLVSTRKGLFTVARDGKGWEIAGVDFLGDNVTLRAHRSRATALAMPRSTTVISASSCTARRRTAGRRSRRPPIRPSPRATTSTTCGAVRSTGARRASGRWRPAAPTSPGSSGAARCRAGCSARATTAQSWEMVRALWDHPKRKQWMGGGADLPGIHSICVDPRNSKRVWIAVSTGGIWFTEDGGASWTLRGEGMRAEYVPPEQTHDPIAQDVHCLVQCPAAPERMWVQHHNGIFVSSDEGRTFTEITGGGAVDVRLRRRRASARAGYRLVRARDQGREAHPASRASSWSRAPATAARASRC